MMKTCPSPLVGNFEGAKRVSARVILTVLFLFNCCKLLATHDNWEKIYSEKKNAIVKITNTTNQFDILQPYKIPQNNKSCGSGCFIKIDSELYILTNYHVVENSKKLFINISSLGKEEFDVEVVGVCSHRDITLLKLKEKSFKELKSKLETISYLELGDSDILKDSEKIMILGYPLALNSLQLSSGIFAGKDIHGPNNEVLHTTAPINPGNSGGPAINNEGKIIGICVSKTEGTSVEGMGYLIPINDIKTLLPELLKSKITRYPYWGTMLIDKNTKQSIKYFSKDLLDHGIQIQTVLPNSIALKYGIQSGDIIYKVNGIDIDIHGYITLPCKDEKLKFTTYITKFPFDTTCQLSILRNCQKVKINITKENNGSDDPFKNCFTEFEKQDYEVIGGMVITPLTYDHIFHKKIVFNLGLTMQELFLKPENSKPWLLITHVLPDSQAHETTFIEESLLLGKVNNIEIHTLNDLRKVIINSIDNKDEYITFENYLGGIIAIPTETIIKDYKSLPDMNIHIKSTLADFLA